jgi:hypothetical protein
LAPVPADDQRPDSAGQSGSTVGMSQVPAAGFESEQELFEEGQALEAGIQHGVENAPPADVAEVETHGEHPDEGQVPPEKQ